MTRHGSPDMHPAIPALRDMPDLALYPVACTTNVQNSAEMRRRSRVRQCKYMRPRVQNHATAALVGNPRYRPNPKSP